MSVNVTAASGDAAVFLLHWNGRGPGSCEVLRFASKNDATAYGFERLPGDRTAHVVSEVGDLSDRTLFNGTVLAQILTNVTGREVKKVASREEGAQRLVRVLRDRFSALEVTPLEAPPVAEAPPKPARGRKVAKPNGAGEGATVGGHRGRAALFSDDAVITVNTISNPLRQPSAAATRYELYRTGQTVREALSAGVWRADMRWCTKKGYITIK